MSSEDHGPAGTTPTDQTPALSPQGDGGGQRLGDLKGLERKRLAVALALSLGIHALLLSLIFGGQGLGLPGLGLPWQDRRGEVPGLRVMIVPARVTAAQPPATSAAAPTQHAAIEQPAAARPALTASAYPAPPLRRTAETIAPEAKATPEVLPQVNDEVFVAAAAKVPPSVDRPADAAPAPIPEPAVIASERPDEPAWVVHPAPSVPTPVIAAARSASSPEPELQAPRDAGDEKREPIDAEDREQAADPARSDRSEREAQRRAQELQAALVEAARLEADRQEAVRQQEARQEAARFKAARLEAERQEAARLAAVRQKEVQREAARQEAARVETARLEAERQEAARLAAALQEAARQEAARQQAARQEALRAEAARLEAERMEAARQEQARQEAARLQAAQAQETRREESRRVMGRQLDEEAARRDAAPSVPGTQSTLPYSWSNARRGRLFGHTHANNELIEYAQAWARKLQLNMTFDMIREVVKRPHINPVVTVAIRHDGSVESVTFVVSSGVAEIDEAIRRIVHGQAPYQAFQPGLAREFDVIEVRRTWSFDMAVRLH